MRSKTLTSKVDFYFTILELLKEDKTISDIAKELNTSKQKLYYHTRKLRDFGFLEKKGYGVWKVITSKRIDLEHAIKWKDKKIRGHAFIWKIKPHRDFNWEMILERKNIPYKLVRGYTPRLIINNKKVWLAKDSIIIYDNRSFYGKDAHESRKYAVYGVLATLNTLQDKIGIKLGKFHFRPTREHYGMIKNELAQQVNKKGEKIIVRDDLDGEWLWIDDSKGMFGELETGGKGFSKSRPKLNKEVQDWYNDHKKHNFKVTPSFLMENMNKLIESQTNQSNQLESFATALNKHIPAYEGMQNEVKKLNNIINELREEIKRLKDVK